MLVIKTAHGTIKRNNGINYAPENMTGQQIKEMGNALKRVILPLEGTIFVDANNLVYELVSGAKMALTVKPKYIGS